MRRTLAGTVAAGVVAFITVFSAGASAATPSVSATPAPWTPYLASSNSQIRQLAQCGSTMYAVGTFTSIGRPGSPTLTRNNVFSFSATTGVISNWNPNANGTVHSVALSADCSTAYLAGTFTTVHGTAVSHLAKVSTSTGAVITSFAPAPNGTVFTLLLMGNRLFVGGSFTTIAATSRRDLATLNATTGTIDPYLNLGLSGAYPNSTHKVYNTQLSTGGTKILFEGTFTIVAGQPRQQIFMVDLGASSATLNAWSSPDFSMTCAASEPFYIQAAAWSPDDQRIYIGTTGYRGASPLCDAAAAFNAGPSSNQMPIWIMLTGCDSYYSIIADDSNVYVGGHQRWLYNPLGCDAPGPGAIARPGLGSFTPSGQVTPWNPTNQRGLGADDLLLTSAGLWVAWDNHFGVTQCGKKYHPGLCFFPR